MGPLRNIVEVCGHLRTSNLTKNCDCAACDPELSGKVRSAHSVAVHGATITERRLFVVRLDAWRDAPSHLGLFFLQKNCSRTRVFLKN